MKQSPARIGSIGPMPAPVLMLECKACGESFPAPIQMGPRDFADATIEPTSYLCPHCGSTFFYNKRDYEFVLQGGTD